jgi:predicted alpha/beta superfamily hydrolase
MRGTRRSLLAAGLVGASEARASGGIEYGGMQPYQLPHASVLPFVSAINGVAYSLYIHAPIGAAASPLRVILTLDADYSFAVCANHLEHLADRQQAEHSIVVSIAYTGAYSDRRSYALNRTRDYTPVPVAEGGYGPEFQAHSGGAPTFLRVIGEEILPRIDARHQTIPSARTLVGHSFGGLFAAYALETRPDLFDQYLLVSPSLWYADNWIFARERENAATRLARPSKIFLGVGALEQTGHDMVGAASELAALLQNRGDPNLSVENRIFANETHASIFPVVFSSGMRHFQR